MSGYTALFSSRLRSESTTEEPDFSGFDDDGDEDHPMPHPPAPSTSSSPRPRGVISLGAEFDDPLTLSTAAPTAAHLRSSSTSDPTVPGAYDFEPQANEGGPPSISQRTRPRPTSLAGSSPVRSYRRPMNLAERLLPAGLYARLNHPLHDEPREDHGLLFSHDGQDDDETDPDTSAETTTATYPPRGLAALHVPLPPRPPAFAPPVSATPHTRIFGGGQGNDGVFANLSAKPDGNGPRGQGPEFVGGDDGYGAGDKDEVLPAYETAALDSTPPYWETTVITPQGLLGPDDICVDGLPVGSPFGFAWNLLVSMSFQFVGFLLTYLLHTTHAAKNGSRAGLGITLIQLGFYLKERIDHPELMQLEIGAPGDATGLDGTVGPNQDDLAGWTWWGGAPMPVDGDTMSSMATATMSALGSLPTQLHGALSGALDASDPDAPSPTMPSLGNLDPTGQQMAQMSAAANEWMAFLLVTVGSFLLIGGCLSYWRAVRWARAVRQGMGPMADAEAIVT